MISWREYIPCKNSYTNNRAEQASLTVWKPAGVTGNEQRRKNRITIFRYGQEG